LRETRRRVVRTRGWFSLREESRNNNADKIDPPSREATARHASDEAISATMMFGQPRIESLKVVR